jgi:hypothetical protein
MRKLVLLGIATAGCFGDGDVPTAPSGATVLFALPPPGPTDQVCRPSPYIGNVAVGSDAGYAVLHAFLPPCSNGAGNASEMIPSRVVEFPLAGGTTKDLGMAGEVSEGGGQKPRIVASGSDAMWAYQAAPGSNILVTSKSQATVGNVMTQMGATTAGSLVADATNLYIAAWNVPTYNSAASHPRFPCCGGGDAGSIQHYEFFKLTRSSPATSTAFAPKPKFYCEQTSRCLVGNSTTLFYLEHGATAGTASISSQPISGAAGEKIVDFGRAPTGLAADENVVVWSTSIDFTPQGGSIGNVPEACVIAMSPLRTPHEETKLIDTDRFSCMDVAIDGSDIYFTIIKLDRSQHDPAVVGVGFGRVSMTSHVVETLATGNTAAETGARSVFVAGDRLIGVGPLIVASISKAALTGRLDFAP